MAYHQVEVGECISSLAYENGLFWETVWNHPNNAALKERRKDPNVLAPGDMVFIPDKREKLQNLAVAKEHAFRLKGVPAKLSLRLLENDKPRKSEPYVLSIDGRVTKGVTGANGEVKISIPPNAKGGSLLVGTGEKQMEYRLQLGRLDPVEEVSGMQMRLHNLGFDCGPVNGIIGPETREALAAFQATVGLPATGEPTPASLEKLRLAHDAR